VSISPRKKPCINVRKLVPTDDDQNSTYFWKRTVFATIDLRKFICFIVSVFMQSNVKDNIQRLWNEERFKIKQQLTLTLEAMKAKFPPNDPNTLDSEFKRDFLDS
jgi:hypothetical protein